MRGWGGGRGRGGLVASQPSNPPVSSINKSIQPEALVGEGWLAEGLARGEPTPHQQANVFYDQPPFPAITHKKTLPAAPSPSLR